MYLEYSLCDIPFTRKPTKKENGLINNSLRKRTQTIDEFINEISSGKSYCGTVFKDDIRSGSTFLSQQIFGVDIDKNLSFTEASEMLSEYGLKYSLAYNTFSHTEEKPRFRLLFIVDGLVMSSDLTYWVLDLLYKFFDCKADKNAKDIARIWHGTNHQVLRGEDQPYNLIDLIEKLSFKVYSDDGGRLRKCLNTEDIKIQEVARNGQNYTVYNSDVHFSPKYPKNYSPAIPVYVPEIKHWKKDELMKRVRMFREFIDGGWFDHNELKGLASNLMYLSGGQKLYNQVIDSNPRYDFRKKDIIRWCKLHHPPPQWIAEFSPYPEDKVLKGSIVDVVQKKGRVVVYSEPDYQDIETQSEKLNEELNKCLASDDNSIYLVRCDAGIGKTRFFRNVEGIVMAFPTHKLCQEHYEASPLQLKLKTPDLFKFFSQGLQKRFRELYRSNLNSIVQLEVKSLAEGKLSWNAIPEDIEGARCYLNERKIIEESDASTSIYTTHQHAILSEFKQHTIVIDENPESTLLEGNSASLAELKVLYHELQTKGFGVEELKTVLDSEEGVCIDTPTFKIPHAAVYEIASDNKFSSSVIRFFHSSNFIKSDKKITYTVNNSHCFPKDKKYIILDATTPVEVYKRLFGERLRIIEVVNTKFVGTLNQHLLLSYSKTGMRRYGHHLKLENNSTPVLTHKCFTNENHYYFSLVGTNKYEGQDLTCVGTPHKPPIYYKTLVKNLNLNVDDFSMQNQRVKYNGREFTFYTFTNLMLQEIHLAMVEGELIQAVNRARLIRYNCTVTLFSNFPLPQANYVY